LLLNCD